MALLVLVGSTWALTGAVTRSSFSEGLLRFLRLPGLLLGGALWAAFLAVLVLTILVLMETPQLAEPGFSASHVCGTRALRLWHGECRPGANVWVDSSRHKRVEEPCQTLPESDKSALTTLPQIQPWCCITEQHLYEGICPVVLFGTTTTERT